MICEICGQNHGPKVVHMVASGDQKTALILEKESNVAFGPRALEGCTTGNENTVFGMTCEARQPGGVE